MNKYQILSPIGEGAYGVVSKCKCYETGCVMAVKQVKEQEPEMHRNGVNALLREIHHLQRLRHPNIVKMIEVVKKDGKVSIVFEYVERNMLQVIHEEYPSGMPEQLAKGAVWQLLQALAYCHSRGVIHRDIKPENLLVGMRDMTVKLCDFGMACNLTNTGNFTSYVSTRWYRAPELLAGWSDYGAGIDVFATGCIFAELLDGEPLVAGQTDWEQLCLINSVVERVSNEWLSKLRNSIDWEGVSMEKVPDQRLLRVEDHNRISASDALQEDYLYDMTELSRRRYRSKSRSLERDRSSIKEYIDVSKTDDSVEELRKENKWHNLPTN